MTRLGYLLPFLWALGCGADVTDPPTTANTATNPMMSTTPVFTTTNVVTTTGSQVSTAAPSSAATAQVPVYISTTKSPTVPAGTTKLTTMVASTPQSTIQQTTSKTDATTVESTTIKRRGTTNTPNVTSRNEHTTQPTKATETQPVLAHTTVAVTSQPSITEDEKKVETKLSATSLPFPRTSEQSNGTGVIKHHSTVPWLSTVSPSPVTMSKTTAGSFLDSTTKETVPDTGLNLNYDKENIKVNCTTEYKGPLVKINIKPSRICGEYANMYKDDATEILKHICTALKPGYQPDKDTCHVNLASGSPAQLVIVDAYVQSSLTADELYASLKHIKKDSSYLFQYDAAKTEEEDLVSIPLISAIVSLAVALLIIAAIYGCWHQRQTRKREQRLTEELQTMENGYHDNPTLEVMETSPEMQEKKGGPNGELGDSWIVPLDNLTREDFDEEEDTHL